MLLLGVVLGVVSVVVVLLAASALKAKATTVVSEVNKDLGNPTPQA